jgi:antitoxin HicB
MSFNYPVVLAEGVDGVTVTFPDVPEAITHGADREEALLRAVEALETALEMYADAKEALPEASKPGRGQAVVSPSALFTAKLYIYEAMRARNVRKADLAKALQWHMPQVDRVLDLHHESRMDQVEAALGALGKKLELRVS